MDEKIGVVIVLYHSIKPNYTYLMTKSNLYIILVDNTPDRILDIVENYVYYIPLCTNWGIAAAQNKGICKAKELGCSYVFFFDQDSIIEVNYIDKMLDEYNRLKNYYPKIAVLGPIVINKDSGEKYKVLNSPINHDCKIVPSIISSGSVMEMTILDRIGGLEEKLFIDYVDNEWGWRATNYGYLCCITTKITMRHKIGQKYFKILGIPFLLSSPVRYYYQYRNYLWLLRRSYVPLGWKYKSFIRKLVEIIIIPCVSKQKILIIKNMVRGIWDGLFKYNN